MKNSQKKYYFAVVLLIISFGVFAFYTSECRGEECLAQNVRTPEKNLAPKKTPEIIVKMAESKEIILLDVREKSEWDEGHIKGAVHIPLGDLNNETLNEISKDSQIYVYCRSGRRAGEAESKLRVLGFNKVLNIGGIIEWQENGGELIK